jgi:hypothetical protein
MYDAEKQEFINECHVIQPQAGDYWSEMFCPYHVVLHVGEDFVVICDKKVNVDSGHWRFDLSTHRILTYEEHAKEVMYRGDYYGFPADCSPNRLGEIVDEWREKQRKKFQQEFGFLNEAWCFPND